MKTKKLNGATITGAALLFAYVLLRLIFVLLPNLYWSYSFLTVMHDLAFVVAGIGLLTGIYLMSAISFGVNAFLSLIWAVQTLRFISYGWPYLIENLMESAAFVLLLIMLLQHASKQNAGRKAGLDGLWFLPGTLTFVGCLPEILANIRWLSFTSLMLGCVSIAAMFFIGYGVCKAAASAAPVYGVPGQMSGQRMPYPAQQINPQPYVRQQPVNAAPVAVGVAKPDERVEKLNQLKTLLDAGVLNQEEFDKMKQDILKS